MVLTQLKVWSCKVLTNELVHVANRLLPSLCAVRMTSIIFINHFASSLRRENPVHFEKPLNSCPLFRHSSECQKFLVLLRIVTLADGWGEHLCFRETAALIDRDHEVASCREWATKINCNLLSRRTSHFHHL